MHKSTCIFHLDWIYNSLVSTRTKGELHHEWNDISMHFFTRKKFHIARTGSCEALIQMARPPKNEKSPFPLVNHDRFHEWHFCTLLERRNRNFEHTKFQYILFYAVSNWMLSFPFHAKCRWMLNGKFKANHKAYPVSSQLEIGGYRMKTALCAVQSAESRISTSWSIESAETPFRVDGSEIKAVN